MKDFPKIPLTPDQVPQQKLYEVVDLPAKPEGMEIINLLRAYLCGEMGRQRAPRYREYLCTVEWAWGPGSSRVDSYYLAAKRNSWHLWNFFYDWDELCWVWEELTWAEPKRRSERRAAAVHLMIDNWVSMRDNEMFGRFGFISGTGSLSVGEIYAIADRVWTEKYRDRNVGPKL